MNLFHHRGTRLLVVESISSSLNLSPIESVSLSWNPRLASAVLPSMNSSLNHLTTAIGMLGCLGEGWGGGVLRGGDVDLSGVSSGTSERFSVELLQQR